MADVLPMWDPGNYRRVLQRIKKLWNEGETVITSHAQIQMKKREIDMNDVANVIRYGQIIEHSKPITYWRYTIFGKAVDGERMKCVVEIDGNLIIVTVI
jgi:energy-coupling factor transporter ATP-binding protein EcfA2